MHFMIIERFKHRDPAPIYRRLAEKGRMMPDGLAYVASWIEPNFDRCFQVMECDDVTLLMAWIARWSDLMDCEVVPVAPSKDIVALMSQLAETKP